MRIVSHGLPGILKKKIDRFYLVFGNEPLLIEESVDIIRDALKGHGIGEILSYTAGIDLDWQKVNSSFNSFSLFSSSRLLQIRCPSGKLGDGGSKMLCDILDTNYDDFYILLILNEFDRTAQSAAWFKKIESRGTSIEAKKISDKDIPRWIQNRLKNEGLEATTPAINRLIYYSSGNLLYLAQEIRKFSLYCKTDKIIDEEMIDSLLIDQSRFSVFALIDAAVSGDLVSSMRILQSLRREDSQAVLVQWALTREILSLYRMSLDISFGTSKITVMKNHKIWRSRIDLVSKALGRLKHEDLKNLLKSMTQLEKAVKGRKEVVGGVWGEIERVVITVCGIKILNG